MRFSWFTVAAIAAVLGLPSICLGDETPKRKPGYWEFVTVASGLGTVTAQACIGEDDDIAVPEDAGDCGEPEGTPAGEEVIVTVVCKTPNGKQTISSVFNGDFDSRYKAVVRMTFDPPMPGMPNAGVTIDAKYLGPECPDERLRID
jgi:hypothetical protein